MDNPFTTFTTDPFESHYDPSELVYLSPDAPDIMLKYDPSKTYIVGGLVDHAGEALTTYAKAHRMGIQMQKLPIDVFCK